jgi:hypothetical protein
VAYAITDQNAKQQLAEWVRLAGLFNAHNTPDKT